MLREERRRINCLSELHCATLPAPERAAHGAVGGSDAGVGRPAITAGVRAERTEATATAKPGFPRNTPTSGDRWATTSAQNSLGGRWASGCGNEPQGQRANRPPGGTPGGRARSAAAGPRRTRPPSGGPCGEDEAGPRPQGHLPWTDWVGGREGNGFGHCGQQIPTARNYICCH